MGLFGSKNKQEELLAEHKFDYINLADFHSHSFWAGFAYVTIYVGILISLCAYAADIYTAASLLIFNKWSSHLQPVVQFSISKWIFTGCIILSFALLAVEWGISIKILKGHGVAEIYLNSNAQRWSCVFGGRGRKEDTGWKRFLVFARLTKSKSGVDYVALFTFFSFKGWIRTIFAEGPRQVINALTLYSVMQADIIPHHIKKGEELGALLKFFENFAALGREDRVQAFVLGSMLFTLVIWAFAMLQLLIGGALYIIYLCHVIGSESGLYGYCKVRVDEKLGDIVASNHRKELARQQKVDTSGAKGSGNANPILARQPTIPLSLLGESGVMEKSNVSHTNGNRLPKLPNVAELEKPAPVASPIETQSRMGSISSDQPRPYGPTRSATSATNDSSRNLLSDQASMGYGGRGLERNPSSTATSIYTQRHGYDNYGNPESPLSMIAPTISAPSVGRPTPTPSRQQMRPPPPLAQQGYWDNGGMRNIPGMHGQQQQQYSRQGPPRGAYFGNYDNRSICDSPSEYGYSGSQYDGYDYNRYEDYRVYPGPYNNSQIAIPEHQEYSRTQTRNSQRPYEGYNSSAAATPAPPPQSAYAPPPPLSRAFTNTSNPQELDASSSPQELDASSSLSRKQSLTSRSGVDDSRSIHSQSHQRFLSDFDFELETKGDGESSGAGELGMEIEMTPQTPIIGVACTEGEVAGDPEREETGSPGVFTETSTFAGGKSSRASEELVRPTSSKSSNNTATNTQEPAQQKYTAYNPSMNIISSISRNPAGTQSPPTPLRRASTTTVDNSIGPIGYLNSASTPRRAGTAPPTAGTSAQQERTPVDYFGTEKTPMRVGTTPPMSRNSQGRNLTGFPREQGEGMRRAETVPVESPPWGQREWRGPMYPRGEGEDIV